MCRGDCVAPLWGLGGEDSIRAKDSVERSPGGYPDGGEALPPILKPQDEHQGQQITYNQE